MRIIECPRCDEGDERHEGRNRCGSCEYTFTVLNGRIVNTIVSVSDTLHQILGTAVQASTPKEKA